MSFRTSANLLLMMGAVLSILFWSSPARADHGPFNPSFEVAVGEKSPQDLGFLVDEEKIEDYDRFFMPAAFLVFEKQDLVLVLDSAKNRVCSFRVDGKFLGETKLPFPGHPVDFAYFPALGKACFIHQDTTSIGVMEVDFSQPGKWSNEAQIEVKTAIPTLNQPGLSGFQRIWSCGQTQNGCYTILLHTIGVSPENLVLEGNGKTLTFVQKLPNQTQASTCLVGKTVFDLQWPKNQPHLITTDVKTRETKDIPLEKAPVLMVGEGFGCRNIRPAGADLSGCVYFEALFGTAEDAITEGWMYKFLPNGTFIGKCAIPHGPEMLTNHFIAVDPSGSAWYMKKNLQENRIGFYRFGPAQFKL